MKKGIIYTVFMSILLLGIIPSVNQNVLHLYNEQINELTNSSKAPNEERVPVEDGTGYLEQPTLGPSSGQKITDYIEGTRIEILGDYDFGSSNYNFLGSGIQSDPYIIDGYSISDSIGVTMISIKDTSLFFTISNCTLEGEGSSYGISLVNVSHGLVENNFINNCDAAISLHSSNLNNISNNIIANSTTYGISLTTISTSDCNNNLITQNTVYNASIAINLGSGTIERVNNNSITWNNFFQSRDPYYGHSVDTGVNNSFQDNHWDDWIGPDTNSDGFVDMPYNVNQPQSCLRFPGTGPQYVALSSGEYETEVPIPGNDVSIELWVNPTSLTGGRTFISKNYETGGKIHNLFFLGYSGDALKVILDGEVPIGLPDGEAYGWQHFVVTLQQYPALTETNVTLYKNGQKLASAITSTLLGDTSNTRPGVTSIRSWYLGVEFDYIASGSHYLAGDYFAGQIDEVRILNRTLTPTEIYQDYASSIPFDFISNGYFNSRNHYPDRSDTLYYAHLDEQSGTAISDSSEYNIQGKIVATAFWDIDQPAGLYFDGSNDCVDLTDFTMTDNFTIELWVNPLDIAIPSNILGKHSSSGENIFLLYLANGMLRIYNRGTYYEACPMSTGWQHLVVVVRQNFTHTNNQLYKNGILVDNTSTSVLLGSTTGLPWAIGQEWDTGTGPVRSDFFKGSIAGIRFLNRTLSEQEIYEDYSNPNTDYPQRSETVAWYHLIEQTNVGGTIVADYSGNEYNGTVHGYVTQSEAWKQGILNFDTSPRVAPIWINDNDDFAACSSSGNGTVDSPYILENYYLISDSTTLVSIYNTTAYFVLQNSFLDRMHGIQAIFLSNVSNGLISNNFITNSEYGIHLINTHHVKISSNEISYLYGEIPSAIYADSSHNNTYTKNTFWESSNGIYFLYCSDNIISFNRISRVGSSGIFLYNSLNNSFYGNLLFNLSGKGINLMTSDYNNFSWNKIVENQNYGLWLSSYLSSSDNNIFQWNYFFDNNPGGTSQVNNQGINNQFSYNYWNDHTEPDTEPDGIVDTPYDIDGGSSQDLYPRALLGPKVTIVSPFAQTYNVPKINISVTGNAFQYWYLIEGIDTQNQTWTANTNHTVPDGTYTLHIYGSDFHGYVTHETVSFTIDFFEITSPLAQEYGWAPINISFSGFATHYWYYVEGVDLENQTWTSNIDRIFLAGSYTIHAYGNDSEGTIIHHLVNITVETTPPIINLLSPQNSTYLQNTILLSYTIIDFDTYTIYLDGTPIPAPSGITIEFPGVEDEGIHNITIIAVDHLGNIARTTTIFSIYIPPTLNINSPLPTSYDTGSITITLSGDALYYWYYIEDVDNSNQTWTTDISRTLTAGIYTLHAYGNESNGAIAHQSVTFTIVIDSSTTSSSTSLSTTTQPSSTTTSKKGSYPGLIVIFFSIIPLAISIRKKKKS